MKLSYISTLLLCIFFIGCENSYKPDSLSKKEYEELLLKLAPYNNKKPDEIDFPERFTKKVTPYYVEVVKVTQASIEYYYEADTAIFFFYKHKDVTSLFEHYRGLGGYFKMDDDKNITFLNLLYHTPRLTKEEMSQRGIELFKEMVTVGNVSKFLGNKKYIHTPNADFYYDTKTNRWDYTENSSWKFLEEARQAADSSTVK